MGTPTAPLQWFVVNRRLWARGRRSYLLDSVGHRDCLGFYGHALGIADADLMWETRPSATAVRSVYRKAALWLVRANGGDITRACASIIRANDDVSLTPAVREARLARLFRLRGITVYFVDGAAEETLLNYALSASRINALRLGLQKHHHAIAAKAQPAPAYSGRPPTCCKHGPLFFAIGWHGDSAQACTRCGKPAYEHGHYCPHSGRDDPRTCSAFSTEPRAGKAVSVSVSVSVSAPGPLNPAVLPLSWETIPIGTQPVDLQLRWQAYARVADSLAHLRQICRAAQIAAESQAVEAFWRKQVERIDQASNHLRVT